MTFWNKNQSEPQDGHSADNSDITNSHAAEGTERVADKAAYGSEAHFGSTATPAGDAAVSRGERFDDTREIAAQSQPSPTYSQGWNQPRTEDAQAAQAAQSTQSEQPYAAWSGQGTGAGYGAAPTAVAPRAEKPKKSVSLPAALALMLAGSVAAGSITGVVVSKNSDDSGTATVSEVLNQPVSNTEPSGDSTNSDSGIEDVASKVLPSVVAIQVMTRTAVESGSGSIISPGGYVLTNHHVIADARQGELQVTLNDGSKHTAQVIASDANTDVGIIKIDNVQDLPYLEFGDSSSLKVGQQVVAVGSPLGLNATVTSGIVSALNRPVRASQEGGQSSLIDAIQTDAAVNPGNSGGPLVDMNGKLVGMNSMIASLSSGSSSSEAGSIGLGFAIPSVFAKRMADQLINKGEVTHPMLGVQVAAQQLVDGAYVAGVEPNSPADKAGLKEGDVITRVNDRLIDSADSLIAATRSQEFGATVTLEVTSEGEDSPRQVEVTLTSE